MKRWKFSEKLQVLDRPAKTWLFDMTADPTERHDLSTSRPDKVSELHGAASASRTKPSGRWQRAAASTQPPTPGVTSSRRTDD